LKWYEDIDVENEISFDDIDKRYRYIAQKMGIKAFVSLVKILGGVNYYVPTVETFLKNIRNKKILAEYNGYNTKELSKKYNLTKEQIHNIRNKKRKENFN